MHTLKLVRHGPKNNDPAVHGTGIEALLAPDRIKDIICFAAKELSEIPEEGEVVLKTTPIERAIVTGTVVNSVFQLDPTVRNRIIGPSVEEKIGSSGVGGKGRVINLGPAQMSKIWAAAKREEMYTHLQQQEDKPLFAWCQVGFDNTYGGTGISIREIASRIGHFINGRLEELDLLELASYDLAIGHSGDIEPFLYLVLAMQEGKDGKSPKAMIEYFEKTGGALNPLQGLTFHYKPGGELYLTHPTKDGDARQILIGREIFEKQAQWLSSSGISDRILKGKLEGTIS